MKKYFYFILVIVCVLYAAPVQAADQSVDHIVIAVVQTGQVAAGGNDYIALHNPTDSDIDVTGWKIQYRSAAAASDSSWTTKRSIACLNVQADCHVSITAHATLTASTYAINDVPTQPLSSGFSDSGGQIRLLQTNNQSSSVIDMLGYGTAVTFEGTAAAAAPALGQALVRKSSAGFAIDTDDNANDFTVGCFEPTINALAVMPTTTACTQSSTGTADGNAGMTDNSQQTQDDATQYLPLNITELLPDPATPATDAADEFIELYNPNDVAVNMTGYKLQVSGSTQSSFTLADDVVASGEFAVIYSGQSHLSLTNTGTTVQLVDPNGVVVDKVDSYGLAKTGEAWANINNVWQWTTTPTPGSANILTQPAKTKSAVAALTTKLPVVPKKTVITHKVATPKATKATTAKVTKPKVAAASTLPSAQSDNNTLNYVLFGAVAVGVMTYIGYEYRRDIMRLFRKIKAIVQGRKTEMQRDVQLE